MFSLILLNYLGRCHTNLSMGAVVSGPTEHCHAPNLDRLPVIELKKQN